MTVHAHDRPLLAPVDATDYGAPPGTTVDLDDAADLLGAALAGCRPCQRTGLDTVAAGDPLAVTHLVGTAYAALAEVLATLKPGPMPDDVIASRYAPPTQVVFRTLRDHGPTAAADTVRALDTDARRAALDDALDQLVGLVTLLNAARARGRTR